MAEGGVGSGSCGWCARAGASWCLWEGSVSGGCVGGVSEAVSAGGEGEEVAFGVGREVFTVGTEEGYLVGEPYCNNALDGGEEGVFGYVKGGEECGEGFGWCTRRHEG